MRSICAFVYPGHQDLDPLSVAKFHIKFLLAHEFVLAMLQRQRSWSCLSSAKVSSAAFFKCSANIMLSGRSSVALRQETHFSILDRRLCASFVFWSSAFFLSLLFLCECLLLKPLLLSLLFFCFLRSLPFCLLVLLSFLLFARLLVFL